MLDGRIYRAGLIPLLLAIVVVAFSLEERPRPIRTTLAPDAFDGRRAFALAPTTSLRALARDFPDRVPGGRDDLALARRVEGEFRAADEDGVRVSTRRVEGETADGDRDLLTVIAERTGRSSRKLVVIAHRDALGRGAEAELSSTAALLELARVFRGRRVRRTLVLVSTSGGTAGAAGAKDLAENLPGPIDAVLVLGDLANERGRRPFVIPWGDGGKRAPLQLTRTVEEAVRVETGDHVGGTRALGQALRLAAPLATGEQAPFLAHGVPSVALSVSGERGPEAGDAVSQRRLQEFGRAALRSITALDNGPDITEELRQVVVTRNQMLPSWAVRLLGAALILPVLLAAVDGFARVRRRRHAVSPWLVWVASDGLPLLVAALLAMAIGMLDLLQAAPSLPPPADALPMDGAATAAVVAVALAAVAGWLALRPVAIALAGLRGERPDLGASAAAVLTLTALTIAVWAVNPFTAFLLIPALHAVLVLVVPEIRLTRVAVWGLAAVAIAPFVLLVSFEVLRLGIAFDEVPWYGVLLVAGGHAGPVGVLVWCLVLGTLIAAMRIARNVAEPERPRDITVRGPSTYAGPGSLGGTESALRR